MPQKPKLEDPSNLLINGMRVDKLGKKIKITEVVNKRLEQIMLEAQKRRGIRV